MNKNSDRIVRRFLDSGDTSGMDIAELAEQCGRLVRRTSERSSSDAVKLGQVFVKRAKPYDDSVRQQAYRSLAWVQHVGGKFAAAEKSFLSARELLRRKPAERARVDRALIDVYMYLGRFTEARKRARMAIATFTRLGADDDLAKTRVNHANLLHRQDRHDEARRLYHQAGRFFARKGNRLAAALCYHNEGNTLVQLFDFDSAEAFYRQAREIFQSEGFDLRANGCRYGLAWLFMLRGDYHEALRELAGCEDDYRKGSQPREVVLCTLDRAEAYLGLNLYADARRAAEDGEKQARKLGIRYEAAKGALFLGKALLAMGRTSDARRAFKRAMDGFSHEKNEAFLGTVELASVEAGGEPKKRLLQIQIARQKFRRAQLPLWEAICDLQILSEWPDDRRVLARLGKNPAVSAVPHLLARWNTLLGDRYAREGLLDEATEHWKKACEVLDAVRAKLPPVDMRTTFLRNQGDPHCRLIHAELEHDPLTAAAWSERYKTAGMWRTDERVIRTSPMRAQAERTLSELASRVTGIASRLDGARQRRLAMTAPATKQFELLQERVRTHLSALDSGSSGRAERIDRVCRQIHEAAAHHPVLQFHEGDGDLIAFVHTGKETRFHRYPDGARMARQLMGRWRFMVERTPHLSARQGRSSVQDEQALLSQIGDWLLSPLELSSSAKQLLIVPEGSITNLPWLALTHHGRPLGLEYELALSPSLRHYLGAGKQHTDSKKIEVFVGDTTGIPGARGEYRRLVDTSKSDFTLHDPCRREDWPVASEARLWHYAGHSELRSDNPFYSSLTLKDGPMFAADFRLRRNMVELVTLAACRTGQQAFVPGEESTGLVRSLLEMGARCVLASQWAVSDTSTSAWMTTFYNHFLSGAPVSKAVCETSAVTREKYPLACHWAAFTAFGAGL